MTTADSYLNTVSDIQGDLDTLSEFSDDLDLALSLALEVLEAPGEIEDKLREKANAVDLPNSVVSALGFLPFGIGTAIKQLDNAAKTVENAVDAQADIMGGLDDSWAPTRSVVGDIDDFNQTANTTLNQLNDDNSVRLFEAEALSASLGSQEIYAGSELSARMSGYESTSNLWISSRDALFAPLNASLATFNSAIDAVEAVVPDISEVTGALDDVISVFAEAKDVADDIEDALDFTIDLPWPIPDLNLLDALAAIGDFADFIVDIIADAVTGALELIGININSVFDTIEQEMLDLLDPLFDVLDDLENAAASLASSVNDALGGVEDNFGAILAEIEPYVDDGGLFETSIYGDQNVELADQITGTAGEDGIFGLEGNDTINGGSGNDFLFGGDGMDTIIGGRGYDEMFGGNDDDLLFAFSGPSLMDGGEGDDRIIGRSGQDTLIGHTGDDRLVGGLSSDTFVFREGYGFDIVMDFEVGRDVLELDQSLVGDLTTGQEVIDEHGSVYGVHTLLDFGTDFVLLAGYNNPNAVADDIMIV